MFIIIAFYYIVGYVNIQIEGFYIERFINICISKSILLWKMDRRKSSILNANISIKDFKRIKQIAKKTKCRIKINSKRGLPFIFNNYKKRKIFLAFLFIVLIVLIISSNFIWNIEIKGNNAIPSEEINLLLENNGLKIGAFKRSVDAKKIINEIRLQRNDIAWIGIDFKGTNAIIEIVEADKKPDIVDENDICNIVSKKDGIITKINVQNGTAMVKVGDIVKKGDILVDGKIQGKYTEPILVHSSADIEAKVWYSKKEKAYFHQNLRKETGNLENKYEIKINNLQINLYKTLSKFKNYDTISRSKKINLFSNFYLPIEFITKQNIEKQDYEVIYSKEELEEKTTKKIEEELEKEIENKENIINRYINLKQQEQYLEVEVVYEVLENIGTKEK